MIQKSQDTEGRLRCLTLQVIELSTRLQEPGRSEDEVSACREVLTDIKLEIDSVMSSRDYRDNSTPRQIALSMVDGRVAAIKHKKHAGKVRRLRIKLGMAMEKYASAIDSSITDPGR